MLKHYPTSLQKQPAWSPDGQTIVYSSGYRENRQNESLIVEELWLVNSKGTDRRRLVANGFSNIQPDWSPGGNKIAFASDHGPGSNMDIWIVDREGKNLRQITFNKALDYDPNWAPNGSQICFTSTRSGKMAIWIIDVISRNAKPLFSNSLSPESKEPDWSPGGVAR